MLYLTWLRQFGSYAACSNPGNRYATRKGPWEERKRHCLQSLERLSHFLYREQTFSVANARRYRFWTLLSLIRAKKLEELMSSKSNLQVFPSCSCLMFDENCSHFRSMRLHRQTNSCSTKGKGGESDTTVPVLTEQVQNDCHRRNMWWAREPDVSLCFSAWNRRGARTCACLYPVGWVRSQSERRNKMGLPSLLFADSFCSLTAL